MTICVQVTSFQSWRAEARLLLHKQVPPDQVQWLSKAQPADLFAKPDEKYKTPADAVLTTNTGALSVSKQLLNLLEAAACFRDPQRWSLLYQVLWRWHAGDSAVLSPADADGQRLHAMAKAVHREAHKMRAFLRFRPVSSNQEGPQFVAWFEPLHQVLPQVAEHFSHRMGSVRWLIATPQGSANWDGTKLQFGAPMERSSTDMAGQDDALWLAYYRSIFNPARLNTAAMQMHMPVRYWKNLPEGKLIPELISQARSGAQRVAQSSLVGGRMGTTIPIHPAAAQPPREQPSQLDQCRRCALSEHATQAVGGSGPDDARIMIVGEQPGDQEDLAGAPFVGPAGKLLDNVFEKAGVDRGLVYLTNAVKHFKWEPRGKRRLHKTPAQSEISACRYWLEQEMAQLDPVVLITLGSTALKSVLQTSKVNLKDMLGKPFGHEGRWIIATYHPAYVLRVPDEQLRIAAFNEMVRALHMADKLLTTKNISQHLQ